eukprot:GEMP01024586.1.p1 GENE.GEMP01024586.1~~GEMP01024586.1.p1  ORF type:complete len:501 (+),score=82.38 GEMP01024586.1:59-1561(+)
MLSSLSGSYWVGNYVFGEDDDDEARPPSATVPLSQTIPWGPCENRGSPVDTPFPFDPTLSVRLHVGDILTVAADACVVFETGDTQIDEEDDFQSVGNGSAEGNKDMTTAHRVRKLGGRQYRRELRHILRDRLRSGEARASKVPPNWPMERVLHTVGPKYKEKYTSSAQNTLSSCLRECFELCSEHKCRTVSMPMMYSKTKNFPLDLAAHTVLRTTRRWLERLDIEALIFVGTQEEMNLYLDLLPIYFPRSHEEAVSMFHYIENLEVGNKFGEVTVAGRDIRISGNLTTVPEDSDDGGRNRVDVSFLQERQSEDFDDVCKRRISATAWECSNPEEVSRVYQRYLREAQKYDFRQLINRGFLVFEEVNGRKVVTILGSLFPGQVDPKILVLFIVSYLDPKIKDRYSLLYVHTSVQFSQNAPSWTLFCELMRIFTTRFTPTLDTVVILHPDLIFKAMFSVAALCIAHTLWPGARYAERLYDLERILGPVALPEYVRAYDRSLS